MGLGNKHFYKIVTKGYNPIAVTRALDTIRKSEKKKTVIWNIEDYWEKIYPGKDTRLDIFNRF